MRPHPLRFGLSRQPRQRAAARGFRIDPEGDWKVCTATIPKDCEILGTVTSDGTTGALVRLTRTGNYVKVMAGDVSIVNGSKVKQAFAAIQSRALQSDLDMVPVE